MVQLVVVVMQLIFVIILVQLFLQILLYQQVEVLEVQQVREQVTEVLLQLQFIQVNLFFHIPQQLLVLGLMEEHLHLVLIFQLQHLVCMEVQEVVV